MALPKVAEVREMSDEELAEAIVTTKKELFNLRLQKVTRRLEKPHEFKHTKHRLSQLLTVEGERKAKSDETASAVPEVTEAAPVVSETPEATETAPASVETPEVTETASTVEAEPSETPETTPEVVAEAETSETAPTSEEK